MVFVMTIAFAAIACTSVCAYWYVASRRRMRARREWESVAQNLGDLDADLDRAWAAELRRRNPHP